MSTPATIWHVDPRVLSGAREKMRSQLHPHAAMSQDMREYVGRQSLVPYTREGSVGIVRLDGATANSPGLFDVFYYGVVPIEELCKALRTAAGDPQAKTVIIDCNSPGGTVAGMADVKEAIRGVQAAGKKVVCLARDTVCSCALWMAAWCDEVYATESATIGNFGCYVVVEDDSPLLEKIGIRRVVVSSGEIKHTGIGALTEAQVQFLAENIGQVASRFAAELKAGRGLSDDAMAQLADGRWLTAAQGKDVGLVDEVIGREALIAALQTQTNSSPAGRSGAALSRTNAMTTTQTIAGLNITTLRTDAPTLVGQIESEALAKFKSDPKIAGALAAMAPATLAQLEQLAPNDPGFVLTQAKANATLADATSARCTALSAQLVDVTAKLTEAQTKLAALAEAGAKPLQAKGANPSNNPAATGTATEQFEAAVKAEMDPAKGAERARTRAVAVARVQQSKPDIFKAHYAASGA